MLSLNRETEEEKAFISAKNRIFFQPLSQYTRYVQHIHWPYTYSSIWRIVFVPKCMCTDRMHVGTPAIPL